MKKNIALFALGIALVVYAIGANTENILLRSFIAIAAVVLIVYSLRHKITRIVKKQTL